MPNLLDENQRKMFMEDVKGNIGGLDTGPGEFTPEYDDQVLANLDALLAHQEKRGMKNILDQQEERGFFRSGQTGERLVDEVLGPGLERRRQATLSLVGRRQEAQREERLGGLQFERQRQLQGEEMERQIAMVELQAAHQRRLMELRASLEDDGGFNWQSLAGGIAGAALGSFAGGAGAAAGANVGSSLFSPKPRSNMYQGTGEYWNS